MSDEVDPDDFLEAFRIVRNFQDEGKISVRNRLNAAFAWKPAGYIAKLLAAIYLQVTK